MSSIYRTSLPLASLTAVGMLATDLYLPAVPTLSQELGGSLTQSQATLAVFMAALAISQLLWGWASDHFGERRTVLAGTALLAMASVVCALAPNIETLLVARIVQGLGAGAATVVVPVLIRKQFSEADAVKSIAVVAMAESVIPAAGPVAGAVVIAYADWRLTFWLVALPTLLLLPVISAIVADGRRPAPQTAAASWSFGPVLRNVAFMRYALSYALMFGALLAFVASAPHIATDWLGQPVSAFAFLQVCGVAAFMLGAAGGGRLAQGRGADLPIAAGVWTQAASCAALVLLAWTDLRSLAGVATAWAVFCAGLGMRGPSTMARALSAGSALAGKASGLLMFLAFAVSSVATMLVAPLLEDGLLLLALVMSAMVLASAALLPRTRTCPAHTSGTAQK